MNEQARRAAATYPPGTRIELACLCNEEPGMPVGLRGTVVGVDDQPALLINWDNGRTLSLLIGEDQFRTLTPHEMAAEQCEEHDPQMGGQQL